MTADEWDTCTNPADMLDAAVAYGYPTECIRVAALAIAERYEPNERDWSEYLNHNHYEGERETKEKQYQRVTSGMAALRKPDCPDPAVRFRDAMDHMHLPSMFPAANSLRAWFQSGLRVMMLPG